MNLWCDLVWIDFRLIGVQIYCFCKVIDKNLNICLDLLDILTCVIFMKMHSKTPQSKSWYLADFPKRGSRCNTRSLSYWSQLAWLPETNVFANSHKFQDFTEIFFKIVIFLSLIFNFMILYFLKGANRVFKLSLL